MNEHCIGCPFVLKGCDKLVEAECNYELAPISEKRLLGISLSDRVLFDNTFFNDVLSFTNVG